MDYYKEDLAYTHDAGHHDFALGSAPGLLAMLRRNGVHNGLVVDLGCGSGLWARELTRSGYDVLGVDISASMIRLARRKAPEAEFLNASFLRVKLPPCAAVTCIGECVNYSFDPNSKRQLPGLFGHIYESLRSGSVFVFDFLEPRQIFNRNSRRNWREGKDWAVLVEVEEEKKRNLLQRRITTFRQIGKLYRRSEEVHCLRVYKER
jgi:SAM-dependent methyltransferase